MSSDLSGDILYLICDELRRREDFATLFSCAVASKQLGLLALPHLYRIPISPSSNDNDLETLGEVDLYIQRWSILWRTIFLSAVEKTIFPYYRYLKILDLRDLKDLLENDLFRGRIREHFFEGPLSDFQLQRNVTIQKVRVQGLDSRAVIEKLATMITTKTDLLEQLSGDISSERFLEWIPRLSRLKRLELWNGETLGQPSTCLAVRQHCPNFEELSIYKWSGADSDVNLGAFISALPPQTLKEFVTLSICGIARMTCLALNNHSDTLNGLELNFLGDKVPAVALLKQCRNLRSLKLTLPITIPQESANPRLVEELSTWFADCTKLKTLTLEEFRSAPQALILMLLNESIQLHTLVIKARFNQYSLHNAFDFHQALANQPTLETLTLHGDGEEAKRTDIDALVNSVTKLRNLKSLRLQGIADEFGDTDLIKMFGHLRKLEDVYVGGWNITDDALQPVAAMKTLHSIDFAGLTAFTTNGLLDLVDGLAPSVQGLHLAIDMADWTYPLTEQELTLVGNALISKVGGRLTYNVMPAPDEYSGSDSD